MKNSFLLWFCVLALANAVGITIYVSTKRIQKNNEDREYEKEKTLKEIELEGETHAVNGVPTEACPYAPYGYRSDAVKYEAWKRGWIKGFMNKGK